MINHFAIFAAFVTFVALIVQIIRLKRSRKEFESQVKAGRLRLELDIKHARDERNRLLDALGDAFLIVDSDANIVFANSAAEDLFRGRALAGRPVREAFLDPRLAEALLRCLETGEPVQSRVVLPQQTSPLGDLETRGNNAWIIDAAQLSDVPDGTPNITIRPTQDPPALIECWLC